MQLRSMNEALQRKNEIADELLQIEKLKKSMFAAVRQGEDFQKLLEQEKELNRLYAYWVDVLRQMGREGKTITDDGGEKHHVDIWEVDGGATLPESPEEAI